MMLLSEVVTVLGAKLIGADVRFESVGSDSRNIGAGQLFVALKGENFDGNQYVADAFAKGAAAVLFADEAQISNAHSGLLVKDTRLALGLLASYWRQKFAIPLIAITGSNGKTTVKEMISSILSTVVSGGFESKSENILATIGNLNNDIGMPLTLLRLRENHQYAVIEMGMNHTGEIDYLTELAKPTVALVNNAGTAHIGELGSQQAIAEAKGEIFTGLNMQGVAIINADDTYANYWKTLNSNHKVITFGLNADAVVTATTTEHGGQSQVSLKTPSGNISFYLNLLGMHNIQNALAASATAFALDVSLDDIAQGLKRFGGVAGRLTRLQGINEALVIDDTYNANPDSMRAAIDVLVQQPGDKVMVMGDMGELGVDAPRLHAEIGTYAKKSGVDTLLVLGNISLEAANSFGEKAHHFVTIEALVDSLKKRMKKNTTILVKGSRFMKMERVVNAIVEQSVVWEMH
ncbi:MAG: UDP-N-acetylmuramoyl-tripeptide--D-alanyl-D-alanine ligase [Methylophilaceae bacterium]